MLFRALIWLYTSSMTSRDQFRGKRVAVIGLGPHGEMVEDAKFLIKAGALVSIYDLRSEARLKAHLIALRTAGLANYVCGSIPPDDLLDMDMVILSHEYPSDSSFLAPVYAAGIPVEYAETLFFKLLPPVTIVGVMGPAGTSTVVSMLSPMIEAVCEANDGQGFFIVDQESDNGALAHLKKVKSGDIVLVRLTAHMMKELHALRMSPQVAVFTGIPPTGSYTASPFEILSFQTYNNFIIADDSVIDATYAFKFQTKAKMIRTKASFLPTDWSVNGRGPHDRANAALALQTAKLFKVSDEMAHDMLEAWSPEKGRLEPVKKVRGVEYYNDSASVSPLSTLTAIDVLAQGKNAVLIFGGISGNAEYKALYATLPAHVHTLILLPGSGTLKERRNIQMLEGVVIHSAPSVEEAVRIASEKAQKGDRVIFSPGFEAGGMDRSRKERGERFVRAVRAL